MNKTYYYEYKMNLLKCIEGFYIVFIEIVCMSGNSCSLTHQVQTSVRNVFIYISYIYIFCITRLVWEANKLTVVLIKLIVYITTFRRHDDYNMQLPINVEVLGEHYRGIRSTLTMFYFVFQLLRHIRWITKGDKNEFKPFFRFFNFSFDFRLWRLLEDLFHAQNERRQHRTKG